MLREDPWWKGGAARRTAFRADGSVAQWASPEDFGGPPTPTGTWRFVRECCGHAAAENGTMLITTIRVKVYLVQYLLLYWFKPLLMAL